MENKSKITGLFLIVFGFLAGCSGKTSIKNPDVISVDKNNRLTLKIVPENSIDTIYIRQVRNAGKLSDLSEILDAGTFDLLQHFKADSLKINNDYYQKNPIVSYYKDKNNVYFFVDTINPGILVNMGSVDQYEVLGGAYLRLNNVIYWNAKEVKGADIETFRVLNVDREKSEWMKTVGIDKNHIYNGNHIMTLNAFERLYWHQADSLRLKYFRR